MNNLNYKIAILKSIAQDYLAEYFQTAKLKSIDAERAVVNYVSKNPFKVIGITATAGLLIGCLCKSRRN